MGVKKEGNVLFNDTRNTFYLRLYGVGYMVKNHLDSERGNPLLPHGLLFPISSKGSFICTIPDRIVHTMAFVKPVVEDWLKLKNVLGYIVNFKNTWMASFTFTSGTRCNGYLDHNLPHSYLFQGARCSSIRAFAHGAIAHRINPSWGGPTKLFHVPASAPQLV